MQTRRESLKEAAYNIAIGYTVALLSQLVVFPLVGVDVDFTTNLEIGLYFTVISLVRSYLVRRWFNRKE
jgi:hypothetical protein